MATPVDSPTGASQTITPHLTVRDAAAAIAFYQQAFGATELYRMLTPGANTILHAELKIGHSLFFLNDEFPEFGATSPQALNGSPVTIHLAVDDADAWFERALAAGATVTMPLQNMFWGDRYGKLVDPFGHHWSISCKVEDVSPAEMAQRAAAAFGG